DSPAHPALPEVPMTLGEARDAVAALSNELAARGEAGPLFGQERGAALEGIIGGLEQTFDGQPLYPTAQVRAAHLLYFVIKDHPFSDGNKRIGTLLFLDTLCRHGLMLRADGSLRLADNAMVALALLVAESAPSQKELILRLILNLLEDDAA
ncbi:MAG: Fic family protein, partial [Actinomycetota bacterium]